MPTIKISGMSCGHCVSSVTKALSDVEGIENVEVDLGKKEATYSEKNSVDPSIVKDAIAKIGFEVIE